MSQYQWIPLEQWAHDHGGLMNFYCVMTTIVGYSPSDGWRKLWSDLHAATPVGETDWATHLRRRLTKIVWAIS